MAKVVLAALMILFFVAPAVFATDYTVGDASGWSQGVNYDTWASGNTFVVGDRLIFTYTTNHQVEQVNKNNYDSCGTSDAFINYSGGRTTITLRKTGPMYFFCPIGGHCSQGMKLTVTVTAASTTPSPPKPPGTTTPTTPTPTKPSAATSSYNINLMVIGASVMLASVFALMV